MSLLSGATLTMAHPDRTRLQVFIPTATATALGIAAESLGLSKTQTVETILGQYLTRQGCSPPTPPRGQSPNRQHPSNGRSRCPPTWSSGCSPSPATFPTPPARLSPVDSHRTAGRQGLPSAEKMDATSKPGQRTNPGEDGRRHQSPPSTKRSQLERSGAHLHPRRLRRGLQRLQKPLEAPGGNIPTGTGPNSGTRRPCTRHNHSEMILRQFPGRRRGPTRFSRFRATQNHLSKKLSTPYLAHGHRH